MRRYLIFSGGGHVLFLAAWLTSGALLSKPRMSYYAVDLVSSLPGGRAGGGSAAAPTAPVISDIPAPKAPALPAKEDRKLPSGEVIQVRGKPAKKTTPPAPAQPQKKRGINLRAALGVLEGQDKGIGSGRAGAGRGGILGGEGGSGLMTDTGMSFPYPWYLKAVADRLNSQWKPPQDFQEDTLCQIAFVIHRDGQISGVLMEQASGDSTFDQLAKRAVLYSNPLPPLPAGFPEDTLRVHMKFVGKPF